MDYFAGLDISMDETHVCVLDREGAVVRESKAASTAEAIAGFLIVESAELPSDCIRDGANAAPPILFHGVEPAWSPSGLRREPAGLPGRSSRSPPTRPIATDARGLAHLARTGFFKPVHVKSLRASTRSAL